MRSNWTGALTLTLGLGMPMKLGSTFKENALGLHMVRDSDGSRIKFTRVAETDGQEVPWAHIAKGYDAPDGSLVVLGKDDFKQAYGERSKVASVLMFTDPANVPPMAVKTSYWVQPDTGGDKTYALLAGALRDTGKVAVVEFAMHDRRAMAVLSPHDGYLSLSPLYWDSDIIRPDFAAPPQTASAEEQSLAHELISRLSDKYDHAAAVDKSSEAVQAVIQAKIEAGQVITPPSASPKGRIPVDLTAALQAAVDAQKKGTTTTTARKPRARKAA